MRPADTWYKRDPKAFLEGAQGMGPELIGAYAVIIDILYARGGDMPRDDRHLSGVLGCSLRKAKALTEALIDLGKLGVEGEKITNRRASIEIAERKKQRETAPKTARKVSENEVTPNENNVLALQKRREENNTPHTPQGGLVKTKRIVGVPPAVRAMVSGDGK